MGEFGLTTKPMRTSPNSTLKLIGIIAMLIDHIGKTFFPQMEWFQMIGRLAFPIFSYQLALGYRYTRDLKGYMARLWIFALIAQIPYMLVFNTIRLNILFTFLIALILLDRIEKRKWDWVVIFTSVILLPYLFEPIPAIEYQWYGLLSPILFHLLFHDKSKSFIAQSILTVLYVGVHGFWIQTFALVGVAVCLFVSFNRISIRLPKWFFYGFYPTHLLLLLWLQWM